MAVAGWAVVYDVTDDWRSARLTTREQHRLIKAEDLFAVRARTVVSSDELWRRWNQRYGLDAVVVKNAVDVASIRRARPLSLGGTGIMWGTSEPFTTLASTWRKC